jgi:DNA polymerase-3 subunit gamma/tau
LALVLARRYRPKSFDELVGQDAISITLSQALKSGRLSHAYLFSGLRGSGKTSTARIFAKALLCDKGPTHSPCQECTQCLMASDNRHIDIIEMDGASNRGIDDVKELIEHTKYKPSIGRFKIFIVDEVHMLTIQAFNALLKTLEEPPEFVKFILATTDPLKLPPTILSRVQHFRFRKISQRVIESHLEHILNLEKIEYEREAITVIARVGAGSLRDALTLLDQAIVYSKSRVDLATVTKMLGIIDPSVLDNLLDTILKKDESGVVEFIKESLEFEAEMVIDELILHIKELLLDRDVRFSPVILDRFFRVLAEAKELLHIGGDGEFVLALTLFKMMEALALKEIDEMIESLESELYGAEGKVQKGVEFNLSIPSSSKKREEKKGFRRDKFQLLIEKISDRDSNLGEIFKRNIEFISFENGTLTWRSKATNSDKTELKNSWILIRTFVQEVFGIDTKIVNLQEPPSEPKMTERDSSIKEEKRIDDKEVSKEEFLEKSSELESRNHSESSEKKILKEPMVQMAIKLLNPKRVIIKAKKDI